MSKESKRPSNAVKWAHSCLIDINIKDGDSIEHLKTTTKGLAYRVPCAGKNATVILGNVHAVDNKITISPESSVWTCKFSPWGVLPSIGIPNAVITVIVHEN